MRKWRGFPDSDIGNIGNVPMVFGRVWWITPADDFGKYYQYLYDYRVEHNDTVLC